MAPSISISIPVEASQEGHITPINGCNKNPSLDNSQNPHILAHIARAKLSEEASRPDSDLRRLVIHANLLDMLCIELDNTKCDFDGCIEDGEVDEEWYEGETAQVEDEDNDNSSTDESDDFDESDDSNDSDSEPDSDLGLNPKSDNSVNYVVTPLASESKPLRNPIRIVAGNASSHNSLIGRVKLVMARYINF